MRARHLRAFRVFRAHRLTPWLEPPSLRECSASVVEAVDRGVAEITDAMQGSLQRLASDIKTTVATAQQSLDKEARAVLRRRRMFSEKRFQARTSVLSTMLADKDFQVRRASRGDELVAVGSSTRTDHVQHRGRVAGLAGTLSCVRRGVVRLAA